MMITDDYNVASPILEADSCYPFELYQKGIEVGQMSSLHNKYAYNGKELQGDLGLDQYEFETGMYNVQIGRWYLIDPLADKMRRFSPYAQAFDNRIRFIDPDGMSPYGVIINGSDKKKAFDKFKKSVNGQLNLAMDESGKVTYTLVDSKVTLNSD